MKVRQLLMVFLTSFAIIGNVYGQSEDPKMDKFINDLMNKMTLDEKMAFFTQRQSFHFITYN